MNIITDGRCSNHWPLEDKSHPNNVTETTCDSRSVYISKINVGKEKVNVKFNIEQVMKVQRGRKVNLYCLTTAIDGVDCQRHAPAALFSGKPTAYIMEVFGFVP